jgi:DNA-binding LacI/PurR family transcriptional regulator
MQAGDEREPAPRRHLTLRDLAASLGVSKTTVSNAFSRPDQLSKELRARVLEAAQRSGYAGPDPAARMLRTRRAGALGLVFPDTLPYAFDDQTAVALLQGIAEACEERRMGLFIVPGMHSAPDSHAVQAAAVDGFIVYSLPRGTDVLPLVLGRRLPVVIVDQPRLEAVPSVGIDDRAAAAEAARNLLGLGHRSFGIVTLPCQPDGYLGPGTDSRLGGCAYEVTANRLAGYRAGLQEAGIGPDEVPVFECARNDEDAGHLAGRYLLDRTPRPTAILAMGDRLALGVLAAARQLQLDVPADLSIIGFDDIPAAARSRPSLTTVRQQLRLKGYAAARMLLEPAGSEEQTGGESQGEARVELPTELVVRQTTGPVPVRRPPRE